LSWVFITVGAGNKQFEEAARRLATQARRSHLFSKTLSIDTKLLLELVPDLQERLKTATGEESPGFGFYSWKSRIAKLAIDGCFGSFEGIVLVDAGCEFFLSARSQKILFKYQVVAKNQGVGAFQISTPECRLTKRSLFQYFPSLSADDSSAQFQSGILLIDIRRGREIIETWDRLVWENVKNVDDTLDIERKDFYAHRHDQSVLSLVLKDFGVKALRPNPPGMVFGLSNSLKANSFPIWWSRNRTGLTSIPSYLQIFGNFTYFVSRLFVVRLAQK